MNPMNGFGRRQFTYRHKGARDTRVGLMARKIKKWLSRPHRAFVAFMILTTAGYGIMQALPVRAAACTSSGNNITISADCTFAPGTYTFTGTLTINSGVTVTAGDSSSPGQVIITSDSIDVQGAIMADTLGYASATGTGKGSDGGGNAGGGAHGGDGGDGSSAAGGTGYGSITSPSTLGSGGGKTSPWNYAGGKGGGAIKLVASGTLTVAGTITADGGTGSGAYYGGGAGGSIWLDAGTLAGSGTLTADGGGSGGFNGGGGGGGRISINYTTDSSTIISGTTYQAYGGNAGSSNGDAGGAGTVFIDDKNDANTNGKIVLDNNDNSNIGSSSTTSQVGASETYDTIVVKSGAIYSIPSGGTLTLGSSGTLTGGGTSQSKIEVLSGGVFDPGVSSLSLTGLDLTNEGTVNTVTSFTLNDSTLVHSGAFQNSVTSITLASGGTFVPTVTTNLSLSTVTVQNGGTLEQRMTTTLPITTLTVQSGGTVTHTTNTTAKSYVIDISATTIDIQSGGTVDVDTRGYSSSEGTGQGADGGTGAGGGGYGGAGGDAGSGAIGGSTYGSATAPTDLGSGGGITTAWNYAGGKGGGAIKLVASGTLTVAGTITADGGTGSAAYYGGGSGGSIWLNAGTLAGNCALIGAVGGSGAGTDGGGGGGGRIYITYTSKTCSGTPAVTGGSAPGSGNAGADGTSNEVQNTPTINGILHSPSSPTYLQNVTLSASATYSTGLDRIDIYLDGTTSGDLQKSCDMASATSGSCSVEVGKLSGSSHTTTVKAYGDDATVATDTDSFVVVVNTTANVATLGRHKINSATTLALSFTLTDPLSTDLTVTFPASFTLTGAFTSGTCASGTIQGFAYDNNAHTLTATKTACTGAVSLSGATLTLPSSSGLYTVTWTNDSPGSVIIPVTDDDQVNVTADVASEMTFDLDISTSDSNSSAPYTLALGTLNAGSANGSDDSSVSGIWVDLDTNASSGAVVQVKSANGSLKSASVPSDTISSSSGDVNGGALARYGMCVATSGLGTPTATVGTFQSVSPFDGTTGTSLGCTTGNASVGIVNTNFQTILNTNSTPISGGRAQIRVKTDIIATTPAHDDYSDTLTFRATATY